jgi:hypothetical protein
LIFVGNGGETTERRNRNAGRLDHAPRAGDRISFERDFGTRFSVFVDTEEEFDWNKPRSRDETATSHIRYLPEFQRLADAHGIKPCYLIDYPIVNTPDSAAIMKDIFDQGRCSIGTQLHAWVNPPFDEMVNTFNSFAGNLPLELEKAKLTALTDKIEQAVGARPVIYRAGRYGIGPNTAVALESLGYRIDTSVRPHFDYSHEGGPSFLRHDARPYWAGPSGLLMELPLGVAFTGQLRRFGRVLYGTGRNRSRLISPLSRSGMLSRVALTPEDMPLKDVMEAIDAMLSDGIRFLSFSFHSPSVAPGHTPYVRNSAELSDFYRWWDKILAFLAQRGVTPVGIDELISAAWKTRTASK